MINNKEIITIKEATEDWFNRSFISVPRSVVEKLVDYSDYNDIIDITPVSSGEFVDYVGSNEDILNVMDSFDELEVYDVIVDDNNKIKYIVKTYEDDTFTVSENDIEKFNYDGLAMWGTFFAPNYNFDIDFIKNHIHEVANLGFKIYESEDYGVLLGIDGAGYNFYEAHWIPLYKLRGIEWHTTED